MRFLWPEMLWLLLLIPLLVGAYVFALRRRKKAAVRYASLTLIRDALGPRPAAAPPHSAGACSCWRLTAAIIAMARPTATLTLPAQYMTIALAIDVSRSMQATDVEPSRLSAAQTAAKGFIEDLPKNVRLGIVTFAGTAAVVQTPTENRQDMLDAIDRFQLQRAHRDRQRPALCAQHAVSGRRVSTSKRRCAPRGGTDVDRAAAQGAGRDARRSSPSRRVRTRPASSFC